uniref:Uncharacterized protein n=1 Tax=Amphimedon queenslandica TaxID=400682 RepID=A0A1X7T418_AMPQE
MHHHPSNRERTARASVNPDDVRTGISLATILPPEPVNSQVARSRHGRVHNRCSRASSAARSAAFTVGTTTVSDRLCSTHLRSGLRKTSGASAFASSRPERITKFHLSPPDRKCGGFSPVKEKNEAGPRSPPRPARCRGTSLNASQPQQAALPSTTPRLAQTQVVCKQIFLLSKDTCRNIQVGHTPPQSLGKSEEGPNRSVARLGKADADVVGRDSGLEAFSRKPQDKGKAPMAINHQAPTLSIPDQRSSRTSQSYPLVAARS